MKKHAISFSMGVVATIALFGAMGAQIGNPRPGAYEYGEAIANIEAEIALYKFEADNPDDATQQKRLAKIKKLAAKMDAYTP